MNKLNSRGTVTISLDEYEKLMANEEKLKKNTITLYSKTRTRYSNMVSCLDMETVLLSVNMDKKGKEEIESKFKGFYNKIEGLKLDIKVRDERVNVLKDLLKKEEEKSERLEKHIRGEVILTDFGVVYPSKKSFWCRLFNC